MKKSIFTIAAVLLLCLNLLPTLAFAQYTKLLDFRGTSQKLTPQGSLISDGTFLYGSALGGTNNLGIIFKIMPDGTGYTKLLDFAGLTNGSYPQGSLISDGTFLYGMTNQGGTNDMGTIFKILPNGTGYSKLLDFANDTVHGYNPSGSLISDGTFLYGMTFHGGTNDMGTIFKILPNGTGYSKLLDFANDTVHGYNPSGSLISDGIFLYGMTPYGGTNDFGTIFKILPNGTGYSKLLDFAGVNNGKFPYGSFISDGTFLYGMTRAGGIFGVGTIYKIKPDGTGYSKLLDFSGQGAFPEGSLISDGTFLYGMTIEGGAGDCYNGCGVIFKIKPDGTGYSTLFDFDDYVEPLGSLITDGTFLYGVTRDGGINDEGSILKIKPDGTGYVNLLEYAFPGEGGEPQGDLISDGTFLYGMASKGGTNNNGVIFKIKPDGTGYTNLFDFEGETNGSHPKGSLISDGIFFYGMTSEGGIADKGTIFKIKPDGTGYSKLIEFPYQAEGSYPEGSLISDGTFLYGMTSRGGTNDMGTISKIKPDGTGYSKLLDFEGATNGSHPRGSLVSDGTFLYGMTAVGGTSNSGTIFKIMPDGTGYSKLLDFAGGPSGSLIFDGTFLYGMTGDDGIWGSGTIFKIMPDGTGHTILLDFVRVTSGFVGTGALIADGTFLYGMTYHGGTGTCEYGCGVIFKIKPDGTGYSKLHDFEQGSDGSHPHGSLIADGTFLYGMTSSGGTNSAGTIFKYKLPCTPLTLSQSPILCAGQSITVGTHTYSTSGNYTDVLTSYKDCDSTVTTHLTVLPAITLSQTKTVCAGQSITIGTHTYTVSGNYTDVLTSYKGCDSTVTTHLTVLPAITLSQTKTVCAGQSVTIGTHTYTISGNYTDVLTSYLNCDSTVTTHLTVLPVNTYTQSPTICGGQSITVGTHTYTAIGNYTDVLTSYKGCDSTVTTHLTVLPAITFTQTKTVCAGQSISVGTHTYTSSGNYTDVLTSYLSCDSTVTTHLTVLPVNTFTQSPTICGGQSITVGTHTYTTSGNYTDVLTSYHSCDSTVTTQLIVNSVDTTVSLSTVTLTANATPATYQWINCNNGNTPIAGQTNQSFTASANGNYAVVVSQNNCSDTSSCYTIFFTGIIENSLASSINIYPNPNTGNFTLEFCFDNIKEETMRIEIFNPLGKSIYLKQVQQTNGCIRETIELDGELAGGVYILKTEAGNKMENSRLLLVK